MTALIEDLFEAEYERLVRSLGVAFDAESAADAVQEAFIRADRDWAAVGSFDDPAGWVRRVALNRLLNGRRDRARRAEILATVRAVPDADLTVELLDLRRAVGSLPDRMRAALCLHYLAGLPVREVAVALEVSEGTVKSNLHDARPGVDRVAAARRRTCAVRVHRRSRRCRSDRPQPHLGRPGDLGERHGATAAGPGRLRKSVLLTLWPSAKSSHPVVMMVGDEMVRDPGGDVRVDANDVVASTTRSLRRVRAEQLDLVHEAVSSGRWASGARFRSPTAWLIAASGESAAQCRLTLLLAERVQRMVSVRAAFAAGELAESALRQLAETWSAQVADAFARDETLLLRWAQRLSFDDLRITLATWRMHVDPDREERRAQERFDARKLHLSELLDGMGQLDGILDPEGYKLVQEAIRDLSARCADDDRRIEQRRADALVTLARFYLTNSRPADTGTIADRAPGKRRRPKVIGTIPMADLISGDGAGTIDTGSGRIVVSPDTIRRLACDAGFHRLVHGADGTILDFGRQTRTISDPLFEVLAARDHGCRILDCQVAPGGCDAHHAEHWADDGRTEPDNLALLCWFHHHLVHEQHWSITPLGAGHFLLIDPDGGEHEMRPPMIAGALPQLVPAA